MRLDETPQERNRVPVLLFDCSLAGLGLLKLCVQLLGAELNQGGRAGNRLLASAPHVIGYEENERREDSDCDGEFLHLNLSTGLCLPGFWNCRSPCAFRASHWTHDSRVRGDRWRVQGWRLRVMDARTGPERGSGQG